MYIKYTYKVYGDNKYDEGSLQNTNHDDFNEEKFHCRKHSHFLVIELRISTQNMKKLSRLQ